MKSKAPKTSSRTATRKTLSGNSEGVAQQLWHQQLLARKIILRQLGASEDQIESLWRRDWVAVSGWVRTRLKHIIKHNATQWSELKVALEMEVEDGAAQTA